MTNRNLRIFVADDDDFDTSLTMRAIRRSLPDVEIVAFGDGAQALETLALCDENTWPDLVLLDFKMPHKGCLELMRELHRPNMIRDVPFVLLSSSVSPRDVEDAFREGIREYVEKPTDPDLYESAVEDICLKYAAKTSLGA